jgi:hypothetical protein
LSVAGFWIAVAATLDVETVFAQGNDSVLVHVLVGDLAGNPVAGSDIVLVKAGDTTAVAAGTSDVTGRHNFVLTPGATRFRLEVRKLGFLPTTRLLVMSGVDTVNVEVHLAPVASIQVLPTVEARDQFQLNADPGLREGIRARCAAPLVACVPDSLIADSPHASLRRLLDGNSIVIRGQDDPLHPEAPRVPGIKHPECSPDIYVNGFRWGLAWKDLYDAYKGFAIQAIEVYRAGAPRPGRFVGDPTCGVIVIWTK